jgi:iron complex transport system permease protein
MTVEARQGSMRISARVRPRGLPVVWGAGAALFVVFSLLVGLAVGPVHIGVGEIVGSAIASLPFLHRRTPLTPVDTAIVWQVRAPRVVLGALVGGMLAVAGACYQGVFRNPLADPYLLGVAAGAGLGATVAVTVGAGANAGLLPLGAFIGGMVSVAAAYVLGRSVGPPRGGTLILAGVTVATFMTAVQTFVQQQHTNELRGIYSWILGGLSGGTWWSVAVAAPWALASCAVILLHRRVLDALGVGDEEASNLGINVARTRLVLVLAATAGTSAVVAVSGLIPFVGIIVPHTVRLLVSSSYRAILPLSLLAGAGFLTLADVLGRTALSPGEVPLGVVTAVCGAPFFAIVLRTSRGIAA